MSLVVDLLYDHESICYVLSEHGTYRLTPVPAAADSSGVVLVNYFSGKSGLILIGTVGHEIFTAVGYSQSDVTVKCVDILSAYGHAVLEGDTVIDVNQRVDASDLSAVGYTFKQRLDGAANTLLGLELMESVSPYSDYRILCPLFCLEILGSDLLVFSEPGSVFLLIRGLVVDAVAYQDADLTVREQFKERFLHYEFFHFFTSVILCCHRELLYIIKAPVSKSSKA